MRGESLTFIEFMNQIRNVRVEPIAGEIIDGEGIFDIHVINVFQTLIVVLKYLIVILFCQNRTCCLKMVWEG